MGNHVSLCSFQNVMLAPEGPRATPCGHHYAGSEVVSQLATKVRPRYHVSGGRNVFYARQPYLNKDLGAGAETCL